MEDFEREYKRLNTAQREAVDTIEGPVMVIAGPGTGKTQLLSLRVANILRQTDINPNNVLCLTYTESGQQAMLERLTQLLGDQAKRVEIHTFHGFGTYLITRFSDYFPELIQFRPADDLALYETLHECMKQLPRANPLSKMAYGQFIYQPDVVGRISQLKRAGISPGTAVQKAKADMDWCKRNGRQISKAFMDAGRLSPKVLQQLANDLEPVLTHPTATSGLGHECISNLREALETALSSNKTAPVTEFKKRWLASEEGKLYFKPADQLKKLFALAELYELYENELKKRKLYDYDDMILFALEKLESNPEFRAVAQETFQYILADEYQDTNAAQAKIITLIADNPVNENRPNVMVVGDDDQAIYGFQGAMGDVLLHFRERWRDVKAITLKDNYRSTQTIIDTARKVIQHGQNRLENYYEDIDKSLHGNVTYTPVDPTLFNASNPQAVLDKAVAAAQATSKDGQLAIIATKHKYLRELADRLDAAKIDYHYEGREDLLKDPAITNMLLLAGAALAIHQDQPERTSYSLPKIFASKLLDISRPIAWQVAVAAKQQRTTWWEALTAMKTPEANAAVDALKQTAASIDPVDALSSLRVIAKQYNLRVSQKTKHIVEHASGYYGNKNVSLLELIRYTDLCIQAGIPLSQKVVKGTSKAKVLLLSAHKSKGLEFETVYLLHTDYHTWFKEKGRRNNLTLPESWNHIEPAAETMDDRLRLLYVVMTRAKRELVFVKGVASRRGTQASDSLPGLEDVSSLEYTSEQVEAFAIEPERAWQAWYLPANAEERIVLKQLLAPILSHYRLSPSHLTSFLDISHGGPTMFLANNLLGVPEPIHPEAVFGSHVHRTLHHAQEMLNARGRLPTQAELEVFALEQFDALNETEAKDIVEIVWGFLEHTDVLQPGGVGEYNFSNQRLSLENMQLTGTVDHFFKNTAEFIVTDFKTGRALNSWHVTEDYYKQKLHRFRQQLLFYGLLFALSKEFKDAGPPVLKIAFVEPSRRDVYYDLTLDYDRSERDQLENLMGVVWRKIQNMDFPDTSHYPDTFDGMIEFENNLLDGAI